jgi:hypothetical protein
METDNNSRSHSAELPESLTKSAHDVGHAVDTTPMTRVNVPNTHIRESVHDVNFSVDTAPTSRVGAPEHPASPTITPAPSVLPDANTCGNSPTHH